MIDFPVYLWNAKKHVVSQFDRQQHYKVYAKIALLHVPVKLKM
jgi:hypothetical protein